MSDSDSSRSSSNNVRTLHLFIIAALTVIVVVGKLINLTGR